MKLLKIKTVLLLSVFTLFFASCSDFLEEVSQDEITPESLEDLASIMYSEAYPYQFYSDVYLDFLTDDVISNGLHADNYQAQYENGRGIFTYNPAMFDGTFAIASDVNSWELYYEKINGCNVILDNIANIDATEQEKNGLKGQALFLRGYYYFKLASIYCQPYSEDKLDPNQALGVPLILSMDVVDTYPKRASLKETFDQIETDLKASVSLLKDNFTPENSFRVGYLTAEAMLTRYYIYKNRDEDLQNIIDYSNDIISNKPGLTYLSTFMDGFGAYGIYDTEVSTEPLWIFGTPSNKGTNYWVQGWEKAPYSVAPLLISLYEPNDLRAASYFLISFSASGEYKANSGKTGFNTNNYGDRGIRNAEVYLNRAEAFARMFIKTGDANYRLNALADLNTLRESRYNTGAYVDLDITDGQELLDFCLQERRRELCLEEGLRWCDIKRLNLGIDHAFIDQNGNEVNYALQSGDLLYALPIPFNVMGRNPSLSQNPR